MRFTDLLLALCVVIIWGVNFVVIKVGLEGIPPFLLATLRFMLVAFPACFFVKRPAVPLKWLVAYSMTISFGQFSLLFLAIKLGMPAGLASLIIQAQVFFTLLFSACLLREKLHAWNLAGLVVAIAGMILLVQHSLVGQGGSSMTLTGLLLTLAAAFSWGLGNISNKVIMRDYPVPGLSLVVWSALIPILPFVLCSLWFEGPTAIRDSLSGFTLSGVLSVLYLSLLSTLVGYGLWGSLLGRYEASKVAPMALLIPVAGIISAALLLNETITLGQITGIVVIIAGLIITTLGGRFMARRRTATLP